MTFKLRHLLYFIILFSCFSGFSQKNYSFGFKSEVVSNSQIDLIITTYNKKGEIVKKGNKTLAVARGNINITNPLNYTNSNFEINLTPIKGGFDTISINLPDSVNYKAKIQASISIIPGLNVQVAKHLFYNSIWPGFTNGQLTGKKGSPIWGTLAHGALWTSLYLNLNTAKTYDDYLNSNSPDERDNLFNIAKTQYQASLILAGTAVTIWTINYIRTGRKIKKLRRKFEDGETTPKHYKKRVDKQWEKAFVLKEKAKSVDLRDDFEKKFELAQNYFNNEEYKLCLQELEQLKKLPGANLEKINDFKYKANQVESYISKTERNITEQLISQNYLLAHKYLNRAKNKYPYSSKIQGLQRKIEKEEVDYKIKIIRNLLEKKSTDLADENLEKLLKKYPTNYRVISQKKYNKNKTISIIIEKSDVYLANKMYDLATIEINTGLTKYPNAIKLENKLNEINNQKKDDEKVKIMNLINAGGSNNDILRLAKNFLNQYSYDDEVSIYKDLIEANAFYKQGWTNWNILWQKNGKSVSVRYYIPDNSLSTSKSIRCEYKTIGINSKSEGILKWSFTYSDENGISNEMYKEVTLSDLVQGSSANFSFYGVAIFSPVKNSEYITNTVAFSYRKRDKTYTPGPKDFVLYNKNGVYVKIKFKLKEKYCDQKNNSKFSYEVSGINQYYQYKQISWTIDHERCDGLQITSTYTFYFKEGIGSTTVENPADYQIKGYKIVKGPYNIREQ